MTIASTLKPPPVRARAAGRVSLLGMPVDRIDRAGVADAIDGFVRDGGHHQIVTINLDFLSIGSRNDQFHALVNDAALVVPDGMPVLWAARYLGGSLPQRITGPDVIHLAVEHSIRHGSSLFFLGAPAGVAAEAAHRLRAQYGAFNIAGIYSPPFGALDGDEDEKIRSMITDARPDFLFVAFGCPKQDFWIRDHADLAVPVSVGIGGSFEFLSGAIPRAPQWAQQRGLEWTFRLYHQPRRLAKRYLVDDVQVACKLLVSRFRGGHASHAQNGAHS